MIRIAGRPILEWIVLNLVGFGLSKISLAVNYLADVIVDHFGDGSRFGAQITYIREDPEKPLGTAGALSAFSDATEAILVMNGDLMTRFDPGELLATHHRLGASATIAVHSHNYEIPFGVVLTNEDGTVRGIVEKPVESWDVAAGIYALEPQLVRLLDAGEPIDIPEVIGLAMRRGLRVSSWQLNGDWADIGRPADLSSARGDFPT